MLDMQSREAGPLPNGEACEAASHSLRHDDGADERLRALLQASGVGLWDWDLTTQEVYFSPEWKRQLGYADHELPNTFETWEARLHPADIARTTTAIQEFREGRRATYEVEFRMRHKDGSWRWIFARADASRDTSGKPLRMMGCHFDITSRKQSEALSKLQKDVLELIASGVPLKGSLTALARGLEAHAGDILCSILLIDADGEHLRHGAAPSLPDAYNAAIDGVKIGPAVGSCGTAVSRKAPVIVADIANDPLWVNFKGLALSHGLRACWSTPIFDRQQQILGTFAIYYREVAQPTAEHRALIELATSIAAVAIGKSNAEGALAASERELRLVADSMPGLVSRVDRDLRYRFANVQYEKIFGRTRQQILGHTILEVVGKDLYRQVEPHALRALQGKPATFETQELATSGERRHWLVNFVPDQGPAGDIDGFFILALDITQRRDAESALLQSQQRLSVLINNLDSIVWEADARTFNLTFVSHQAERILGYPVEAWTADADFWQSHMHPDDRQWTMDYCKLETEACRDHTFQYRMIAADGRIVWLEDRVKVITRDGRPHLMHGVMVDITGRMAGEAALRSRERELQLIAEKVPGPVAHLDGDLRYRYVNDEFVRTFGKPREWIIGRSMAEVIGAELYERNRVQRQRALAGETVAFESHLLDADGRETFSLVNFVPVLDAARRIVGMIVIAIDITQRKRAEAAQAEALDRLQKIASRVPGAVYQFRLRPDGSTSFPYASEGMRRMLQLDPENLREDGTPVFARIHPEDVDRVAASARASAQSLTLWHQEFRVRHADGMEHWLAGSAMPQREADGSTLWDGYVDDVTERKQAEASLSSTKAMLERTGELAKVGGWELDMKTRRLVWSKEASRIFGVDSGVAFTPEQAMARFTDESRQRLRAAVDECLAAGKAWNLELQLVTAKGRTVWVRKYGFPVMADDKVVRMVGAIQDISEQKAAEDKRASLEAQLRESQKMEAIGTLAGGIAHDFNNIIAAILGNVDLAVMDATGQMAVLESLGEIRKASTRARDLVQRILSFSRRQPSARKPTSLANVVYESARLLRTVLPSRVTLEVHCATDVPHILADTHHLEQVVMNLVTNAVQALADDKGCITINVDSTLLDATLARTHPALGSLHARFPGPVARLTVRDTGPGMDAVTLGRIFEPFFTTKPVGAGTGLGLSVVHGIVQEHDGVIVVDSAPGHGATFTIYLPLSDVPQALPETPAIAPADRAPDARLHILYLDDEPALVSMIKRMLERRGYRVSGYTDQQAALDDLRADTAAFDIVVTDYNMPNMSGLDVARAIRDLNPRIPVAIATGYVDDQLRHQAAEAGVREFVPKAGPAEALGSAIERLAHTYVQTQTVH